MTIHSIALEVDIAEGLFLYLYSMPTFPELLLLMSSLSSIVYPSSSIKS